MLTNKIVLITGASSGIGALAARYAAERGAVPVLAARSEDKLRTAAAAVPGPHGIRLLDVGSAESVRRAVSETVEEYGRIDVLVNNAGYGLFETAEDMSLGDYEGIMNVNYFGVVRCTKEVLPIMRKQGGGQIVTVASMAGKFATAKSAGYAASKHAALGFMNSLRQELRGSGIAVSSVNPGPIDTPFFDTADPDGSYVKSVKKFILPPEKVAGQIVRIMETRKDEIDLPRYLGLLVRLYGLMPRTADKLAGRFLNLK
ncbi:SDR family oxidoreductase [Saccharibacillus sp. CPCC 101409]|uniref:SDR family NAD(P)-dependent oxidoreductase n=1 Tax=Saccharibacillus sp. CPCC 101409 TaxID=3058041 RepID=UPI0026735B38|nr:SDR family oxidoreductase [Saccharibacillus sp. CPCC 101409]MDO3411059.1 SDR family oxidoreductase [Saccharibacillus sp. CPCC 101409]